ncbi:lanthionine synthetase LanC family protein [Sphaerisporangium sp. NPDC051011]|uniref:lanthionine synthetase LanC family protein n=1 Tax=Sphaerisporangium sp. NPDC051011 TaxID=3155792 RepID=UPI0033E66D50
MTRRPTPTAIGDAAITSLAGRPAHRWDTEGPSLCHGNSGVLQSIAVGRPATADLAASAVTAMFDPQHAFGVRHLHHGTASDDPGLLTGAAGIALALADHGGLPEASAIPARWDAVLLLS